jgi:hypothetical protein
VIEDSDLQNEPLEIKVLDYDQITYNDSIGTLLIDLNPLLAWVCLLKRALISRTTMAPSRAGFPSTTLSLESEAN